MKANLVRQPSTSANALRQTLQTLLEKNPNTLVAEVASSALDYTADSPEIFFQDLMQCGCAGGMVAGLVYYIDTRAFYDRHYDEIEWLRLEYEDNTGQAMTIHGDLKNFYAWFAFEETAYRLAVDELALDL